MNTRPGLQPILIYRPSPFGRMYLCADGTTSSDRLAAAEHYGFQFRAVVRDHWIVNTPERAKAEIVRREGGAT